MWSTKAFFAAAIAVTFVAQAHAHAAIATSNATLQTIKRSDVTSTKSVQSCPAFKGPAGTPAVIKNGAVQLFAASFNGGTDGSLDFKAALSTTGAANSFKALTVTTNGPNSPPAAQQVPLTVAIPAGTDCTAAPCTIALQSGGNFGNCVQISGSTAAAAAASNVTAAAATSVAAASSATAAAGTNSTAATAAKAAAAKKKTGKKGKKGKKTGAKTGAKKAATAKKATAARAHARDFEGIELME